MWVRRTASTSLFHLRCARSWILLLLWWLLRWSAAWVLLVVLLQKLVQVHLVEIVVSWVSTVWLLVALRRESTHEWRQELLLVTLLTLHSWLMLRLSTHHAWLWSKHHALRPHARGWLLLWATREASLATHDSGELWGRVTSCSRHQIHEGCSWVTTLTILLHL